MGSFSSGPFVPRRHSQPGSRMPSFSWKYFSCVHLQKAIWPTFRSEGGATKVSSPESWKALGCISSSTESEPKSRDLSCLHPANVRSPIVRSARGSTTVSTALSSKRPSDSRSSDRSLRSARFSALQPENTLF